MARKGRDPRQRRTGGKAALAERVARLLATLYPDDVNTELNYANTFELLVATMLSAQCTDVRVNATTPALFKRFKNSQAMAKAKVETLEKLIGSIGLHRTKSRNLITMAKQLVADHCGQVPDQRTELEALAGVGRKTASVVLWAAFNKPALAVDTHVHRVANRLGLVTTRTPLVTERKLTLHLPESSWGPVHHRLIQHGRQVCKARQPACATCKLAELCRYALEHKRQADS